MNSIDRIDSFASDEFVFKKNSEIETLFNCELSVMRDDVSKKINLLNAFIGHNIMRLRKMSQDGEHIEVRSFSLYGNIVKVLYKDGTKEDISYSDLFQYLYNAIIGKTFMTLKGNDNFPFHTAAIVHEYLKRTEWMAIIYQALSPLPENKSLYKLENKREIFKSDIIETIIRGESGSLFFSEETAISILKEEFPEIFLSFVDTGINQMICDKRFICGEIRSFLLDHECTIYLPAEN